MIPFTFSFSIMSATSGCNSFCFSKPKRNCFIIVCEKVGVNMRKKAIFTKTVWTFCLENNMHENYLLLQYQIEGFGTTFSSGIPTRSLRTPVPVLDTFFIRDTTKYSSVLMRDGLPLWVLLQNCGYYSKTASNLFFNKQKTVSYSYPAIFLQNIAFLMRGERETWI